MSSEKRKWFDPRTREERLVLQPPVDVSSEDAISLREALDRLSACGRLSERSYNTLRSLCTMPPASRLARNVIAIVRQLHDHSVFEMLQDGLTEAERDALTELAVAADSISLNSTAQGLLQLDVRQAVTDSLQNAFCSQRTRNWPV